MPVFCLLVSVLALTIVLLTIPFKEHSWARRTKVGYSDRMALTIEESRVMVPRAFTLSFWWAFGVSGVAIIAALVCFLVDGLIAAYAGLTSDIAALLFAAFYLGLDRPNSHKA